MALPYDLAGKRVYVAGHGGMVGSALVRRLAREPCEVVTAARGGLDLRVQADVQDWMAQTRPHAVIIAAARVGGIMANDARPADFLHDNLMIAANLIDAAHRCGVEKLLFLGSACIYPRMAAQPIREAALLTGPLEPTNAAYAMAKIAGLKLCEAYRRQHGCDFISAMPANIYGPNDNFDPASSHVVPALLDRMHAAKMAGAGQVTVWGTGAARREFLHVDDCADALVLLLKAYSADAPVNVGSGEEITIAELAALIRAVVGFEGEIVFDASRPDGAPRRLVDSRRLRALGWTPRIGLAQGLRETYAWYLQAKDDAAT